jgi:hypothetical protein
MLWQVPWEELAIRVSWLLKPLQDYGASDVSRELVFISRLQLNHRSRTGCSKLEITGSTRKKLLVICASVWHDTCKLWRDELHNFTPLNWGRLVEAVNSQTPHSRRFKHQHHQACGAYVWLQGAKTSLLRFHFNVFIVILILTQLNRKSSTNQQYILT